MMYLLTGSNGVLGKEIQKYLDCIALTRNDFDIAEEEEVYRYLRENPWVYDAGISGVIHCAAYTDVSGAEKDDNRQHAIDDNVCGTSNMAHALCYSLDTKMIYMSTDYVYPGNTGNYKETDRTQPVNFYAITKLVGEAYARPWKDLVIRTSFKPSGAWPYPKAFDDIYTSADYVDIIAKKICFLISSGAIGIYNVGTERKTVYELAKRRTPTVEPMSRHEIKNVHLPSDVSMNLDKFNTYYDDRTGG